MYPAEKQPLRSTTIKMVERSIGKNATPVPTVAAKVYLGGIYRVIGRKISVKNAVIKAGIEKCLMSIM